MAVAEYMQRFDELKTRSQIVEDPRHTLARFKSGLRFDIRKESLRQPPSSVEHAFQAALDMEEYLRVPTVKKITYQAGEIAAKGLLMATELLGQHLSNKVQPTSGTRRTASTRRSRK